MSSKDSFGQHDPAKPGEEKSSWSRKRHADPETYNEDESAAADEPVTVEEVVRSKFAEMVGGPRGGLEAAAPMVTFAFVYTGTGQMQTSLIVAAGVAFALLALRLIQRSSTHHVRSGLIGIAIGAAFVYTLGGSQGGAENVFLPGIIGNAVFALLFGGSVLLRRPLFGYLIGGILGDPGAMRRGAGVMKLANRITLLLMVPGIIRVCVKLPLYLAGEVGWLGVTSFILGWPLFAVFVALVGIILARGHTPLEGRLN